MRLCVCVCKRARQYERRRQHVSNKSDVDHMWAWIGGADVEGNR